MTTTTTTTQSGRVLAETEAGGQVVRLSGGNDEMTFWGTQRATGANPGDAVTVHRSARGLVATWWATLEPIGDGSPDRPYALRVERGARHNDEARIRGAVFSYFGYAAARGTSVTSLDGETYRVTVPNLSGGSTSYRVEWR